METSWQDKWDIVPLGTLAEFKNGVNYSKENFGKGLKVINVGDFKDYTFAKLEGLDEINPEGIVREKDLLKNNDILFVRSNGNRELIGRSVIVAGLKEKISHSAFTIRGRFVSEKATPRFYAYVLRSPQIRQKLSAYGGGTNISNLNQQLLNSLPVPLPPLETQRKIASILSAYDYLIENNTRRIKILEEMARMIYREWFVNFRFPGHEQVKMVDSPLGLIPEGWEVVTVEKVIRRVSSGKKYDNKTASPIGSVPVLDQGKSGVIGYHNDEPGVIASEENPIIVFANHTCYQRLIQFPFSAIQNVLPFLPSKEFYRNIYWLHWATKDLIQFNDYKGHWPEFIGKELLLPEAEACENFGKFVRPIVKLIYKMEIKNQNLRQTRDLLLPKLISGKVAV